MKKTIILVLAVMMLLNVGACKKINKSNQATKAPISVLETRKGIITTYTKAEFEKYNSPAEENGLDGDMIYIEGKTSAIADGDGHYFLTAKADDGNS